VPDGQQPLEVVVRERERFGGELIPGCPGQHIPDADAVWQLFGLSIATLTL